jgi:hypothetical protein
MSHADQINVPRTCLDFRARVCVSMCVRMRATCNVATCTAHFIPHAQRTLFRPRAQRTLIRPRAQRTLLRPRAQRTLLRSGLLLLLKLDDELLRLERLPRHHVHRLDDPRPPMCA